MVSRVLAEIHQTRLAAQPDREVSLYRGPLPEASSISLAAQLLGQMTTAGQEAVRAEHKLLLQEALNGLDRLDREVLVLRHFERLGNDETALALGISKAEASNGYLRALKRLKHVVTLIPGLGNKL
jgi:RNA polymerase sigma-70 factor (ECF subfamily)